MPLFQRRNPEDAPASGDPAANLAAQAELRPQSLTQELLDWLIAALENVIRTPEVQDLGNRRAVASLRDALKYADHLYPHTVEVKERTRDRAHAKGEGMAAHGSERADERDSALDQHGDRSDREDGRRLAEPARSPLDDS